MLTRPSPLPPAGIQLGTMEVCHLKQPKGELFPPAESYFCCLAWGISGRFSIHMDDRHFSMGPGEFLLLEPGGELSVYADQKENEAYYLLLDGPQAGQIAAEVGFWNGVFPYKRSPVTWLEKIASDMNNLETQQTLSSIGYSLLQTAFQDASACAPDRMVWDACRYLHKTWNRPGMNVDHVLKHLQVSRSTLSPRFRKVTGCSMLEYLMQIRYQKVRRMLETEYASISDIARRCGFPDASYFSTWFRKRSGQTPRAMKKKSVS